MRSVGEYVCEKVWTKMKFLHDDLLLVQGWIASGSMTNVFRLQVKKQEDLLVFSRVWEDWLKSLVKESITHKRGTVCQGVHRMLVMEGGKAGCLVDVM